MRRWGIVLAALLALPVGSASGATRYAAPSGTGSAPCTDQAAPCALPAAVAEAVGGEDVRLAGGTYLLTSTLTPQIAVRLVGEPGPSRPHVVAPAGETALFLRDGAVASGLQVSGTVEAPVIDGDGDFAVRSSVVLQQNAPTAAREAAVVLTGATLSSSVVATAGTRSVAVLSFGGTVSGSTLLAPADGGVGLLAFSSGPIVQVRDTVVRGGGGADGADLVTLDFSPEGATAIAVERSSFRASRVDEDPGAPVSRGAGNQDADVLPPKLSPDGHQLDGSPTIDAGDTSGSPDVDVDGDPRAIGAARDIGADERTTKPVLSGGSASYDACTTRKLAAAVQVTNGGLPPTALRFEVRRGDGTLVTLQDGAAAESPRRPIERTVSALLAPGAQVAGVTAVATNALGETRLELPLAVPACAAGPAPKPAPKADGIGPRISALTVPKAPRRGTRPLVRVTLLDASQQVLLLEKLVPGRRAGRSCSTKARRGRRCTKVVRVTRRTGIGPAGTFTFRLPKLGTGRYRLTFTAKDAAGDATVVKRSIVVRRR